MAANLLRPQFVKILSYILVHIEPPVLFVRYTFLLYMLPVREIMYPRTWQSPTWATKYFIQARLYCWCCGAFLVSHKTPWCKISKSRTHFLYTTPLLVNSFLPSDATWMWVNISSSNGLLHQATSHYLSQCWLIISEAQGHSSKGNFKRVTSALNHWNEFENYLLKISFKFPRSQWVKMLIFIWNLTSSSRAPLPKCLLNFRGIGKISAPRDSARSYDGMLYAIYK